MRCIKCSADGESLLDSKLLVSMLYGIQQVRCHISPTCHNKRLAVLLNCMRVFTEYLYLVACTHGSPTTYELNALFYVVYSIACCIACCAGYLGASKAVHFVSSSCVCKASLELEADPADVYMAYHSMVKEHECINIDYIGDMEELS